MGRPSEYSIETATAICAEIVDGKSLRSICSSPDMPDVRTVYRWLAKYEDFCQQYTRAKEDQADTLADEIIDIADDISRDTIEVKGENGEVVRETPNSEWINRSRLRVDARKWIASKLKPKKYGDKLEHTGNVEVTLSQLISGQG